MTGNPLPPGEDKNNNSKHSSTVAKEKHERLARSSLHDLLHFSAVLDDEIIRLQNNKNPDAKEQGLLQRMLATKGKFDLAISGMKSSDNDAGRHALICFADSVQDIIAFIHKDRLN